MRVLLDRRHVTHRVKLDSPPPLVLGSKSRC
jgi:hypothetical protein